MSAAAAEDETKKTEPKTGGVRMRHLSAGRS